MGDKLTDRQVEGTLKFGIEGKMNAQLYILEDELQQSLEFYHKTPEEGILNTNLVEKFWQQNCSHMTAVFIM